MKKTRNLFFLMAIAFLVHQVQATNPTLQSSNVYNGFYLDLDLAGLTTSPDDAFGHATSKGDYNGDGYMDLAVGIPRYSLYFLNILVGEETGAVLVFWGGPQGIKANNSKLLYQVNEEESEDFDWFGRALTSGDFNNDGLDDLVVGIPREDVYDSISAGIVDAGAVNIFYGHASDFGDAATMIHEASGAQPETAPNDDDQYGQVITTGDFDNDGFDDLVVGIYLQDFGTTGSVVNGGKIAVYYGSAAGIDVDSYEYINQNTFDVLDSNESGDLFGRSLAAGDFTGDGIDDLAVGVPGESINGLADAGMVQLFRGSAVSGVSTNDSLYSQDTLNGALEADDGFGHALAAGDINGDGIDDLVVGIWKEDIGSDVNAGAVQILMGTNGTAGPSNTFGPIITQNDSQVIGTAAGGDRFGQNVLLADLDNDGYDDLIVGSPRDVIIGGGAVVDNGGGVNVLFSNGSDISFVNDLYFTANDIGDQFGYAITAGHFRGAHRPTDLVVGIPGLLSGDSDSDAGAVEVMEFEYHDVIFKDGLDF